MSDKKLGRGLDFLIKRTEAARDEPDRRSEGAANAKQEVPTSELMPNPYQPRKVFDIDELNSLIESIRIHGIMQPIAVRRLSKGGFEIISGERRWRACQELGLESIPAVILDVDDQKMLELALIENIQRSDLDAIEKAKAYSQLIREFKLTQEEAAKRLSVKRSTVANHVRLLDLDRSVQEMVASGKVSMGHARALLALPTSAERQQVAERVARGDLTVRDVEKLAQRSKGESSSPRAARSEASSRSPELDAVTDRMRDALGVRVAIRGDAKRGRVELEYRDGKTLDRILDAIEKGGRGQRLLEADR